MLITVLLTRTPKVIREHLQLNIRNMKTYNDFVDCIESYYGTKTFFGAKATDNSPGGLASMDVGALIGAIRKKGYGEGKTGQTTTEKAMAKENQKVKVKAEETTDQKVKVKVLASQATTQKVNQKAKVNSKVKLTELASQATPKEKENQN